MIIYSLFMSFVIVRVSSYSIMNYIKDVAITNAHIKLAFDMNNIVVKDHIILNGLEHVIKKIVGNNNNGFGMINNMIVVPEYAYLNSWIECKQVQTALRVEIQNELNIAVPKVSARDIYKYTNIGVSQDPDQNLRTLHLKELGAERREFTGKALKTILNRTINYGKPENVTNLLEERRLLGVDTLEKRIIRALAGPETELSVLWMCRLIALFMNTKFPGFYIKEIDTNSTDTCTMIYNDQSIRKTYRKIDGQWCEVIVNELDDDETQPLKEQLL